MEAYQERVIAEKRELDERKTKLIAYLQRFDGAGPLSVEVLKENGRLFRQLGIMHEYSEVLGERIAAFSSGEKDH